MKKFRAQLSVKRAKQVLCVTLSLALALFCVPAIALAKPAEGETINYVSLGDSFTSGWGLDGCLPESIMENPLAATFTTPDTYGYRLCPDGSYPDLIVEELESRGYTVHHDQLAQTAMRVDDLRILLDENYPVDDFNKLWYQDDVYNIWGRCLDELRADYRESLANADLITFDLGKNNFGAYLSEYIMWGEESAGSPCWEALLGEDGAMIYETVVEVVNYLYQEEAGLSDEEMAQISGLVNATIYALLGFEVNLDATLDIIRELNPDAEIVFVNLINPNEWVDVELYGVTIPLGTIMGSLVDIANAYAANCSSHKDDMYFANVDLTNGGLTYLQEEIDQYDGTPESLTQNMKDLFDVYNELYFLSDSLQYTLADLGYGFGEALNPRIYEHAQNAAYDAAARIYQTATQTSPIPYTEILACEDIRTELTNFLNDFCTVITEAGVYTYINEFGYAPQPVPLSEDEEVLSAEQDEALDADATLGLPEEERFDVEGMVQGFIDNMVSDKLTLGLAAFCFDSYYGGGATIHPSYAGHRAIADAILKAWDEGITANPAFQEYVDQMIQRYQEAFEKFGVSFVAQMLVQVEAVFEMSDIEFVHAVGSALGYESGDVVLDSLLEALDIRSIDQVEKLANAIDCAIEIMDAIEAEHEHFFTHHAQIDATCTTDGRAEYWSCELCDRAYYDKCGHELITDMSTLVIPALGHSWTHVEEVSILGKVVREAHDVCDACGGTMVCNH